VTPWEELAEALEPGEADPEANIYPAYAEQIEAPAIVLQPDEPWMTPSAYQYDQERYVAIAAVKASEGRETGVASLYALIRHVITKASGIEGVSWEEASAPVIDESTGTPFLAARVRLTYRKCEE
jgi:hypothetical protein